MSEQENKKVNQAPAAGPSNGQATNGQQAPRNNGNRNRRRKPNNYNGGNRDLRSRIRTRYRHSSSCSFIRTQWIRRSLSVT